MSAVVCLLVVFAAPAAFAQTGPVQQVERLNGALLEAMQQAETLGFDGRYQLLEPVLKETFGFAEMARTASGSYWGKFDEAERQRYVDAFSRMSIATFAARFDGFSGETFEIVGETPGPRDSVSVGTRILSPGEEPVSINYVFRQLEGGWQVVDVYLQSTYSEVAVKRSEYTSLLRQGGLEGLIGALDRKIAEMKAGAAT